MAALARCYGTTVDELLDDDVEEALPDCTEDMTAAWGALSRGGQHAVLRYARGLLAAWP